MSRDLAKIGDSAAARWQARDFAVEQRLERTAYLLSRTVAAVDSAGPNVAVPRLGDALDEALRQFEHGSVALMMNLTPLAADAARRVLEVMFISIFLRDQPHKLAGWHGGAQEFGFKKRMHGFFGEAGPGVQQGPYGAVATEKLYEALCLSVHANPTLWNESRQGLTLDAKPATMEARERMLHDAVRTVVYATLHLMPDLDIDDIETLFGETWPAVEGALGR